MSGDRHDVPDDSNEDIVEQWEEAESEALGDVCVNNDPGGAGEVWRHGSKLDFNCAYVGMGRRERVLSEKRIGMFREGTHCSFPLEGSWTFIKELDEFGRKNLQVLITEGRKRLSPWKDMFNNTKQSVHTVVYIELTSSSVGVLGRRSEPNRREALTIKLKDLKTSLTVVFSFCP